MEVSVHFATAWPQFYFLGMKAEDDEAKEGYQALVDICKEAEMVIERVAGMMEDRLERHADRDKEEYVKGLEELEELVNDWMEKLGEERKRRGF
jgi:uncharacterized protein (DUF1015 family)